MKTNNTTEITSAKILACQEKYFALFDKYIPDNAYTKTNNVLLFDICNEGCIELIVQKNPDATYFVYDNLENTDVAGLCDTLPKLMPNTKFVFIDNKHDNIDLDKQFEYNLSGMKFDCIIMNPPYGDRYNPYLHNKIYELACNQLNNNGICVSLMPVGKLQTPRLYSNKHLMKTKQLTTAIDIILSHDANTVFSTALAENLGIYTHSDTHVLDIDWKLIAYKSNIIFKQICEKIYTNMTPLNKYTSSQPEKFSYKISLNHGHPGCKDEFDLVTNNEKFVFSTQKSSQSCFVNFDTENERANFKTYLESIPIKFLRFIERNSLHIYLQMYPWLGDAINPRTGLKGYESEWTDEDFYTFFNITPDEQKIIEETMKKYK